MAEEEEGLLSMTSSMTSSANLTVNPFETASLDSLHLPAFSPSVFKASQNTPCSKKKGGFRWSIDQMSLLYPADIDELPQQQDASFIPKEKEEQVQDAINQFFSQKVVVPSPWSESKPMKHVTFSPKPPSISILSEHSAENSLCSSTNGSFVGNSSGKVDVSCQTAITLPLNFDLQAFLGKGHFMYTKTSVESFPVAPLRRKLFTQSESSVSSGLPSASPLSASSRESGPFSPSISPIKSSQESSPVERIPRTPNSVDSQFSSSPIARFRTTPLRPAPHVQFQASPLCGKMVSPLMSPIRETPQGSGLPRSPTTHNPIESLSTGDHISPVIIKGNSLYHQPRPSENMMETSLPKAGILEFKPQMADVGRTEGDEGIERRINFSPDSRGTCEDERDGNGAIERREELSPESIDIIDGKEGFDPGLIIEFNEDDGEEEIAMERRKDFTLGLTREFSPIQKIGDHISTLDEPGCSSRLHGTQEESSMDTSLMSNRGQLRESIHASSPPRSNIPCDFSLEASTALSPIPKTGELSLPLSPVRTETEDTKDEVEMQSFRPTGRHKMVSFHIGTEFSPIRYPDTGSDHISGQTMPITSSRVHESNTELLMETSLFSLDGQNVADVSERVENLGADDGVKVTKNSRISPERDPTGPSRENNVPDGDDEIHNKQNYLESSREGLQQKFAHVQTTPKEAIDRVGMDHDHLFHKRKEDYVTTGTTDTASSQYPPILMRTSSVRDGASSACSRSCESCDHSSACWVADWTSSSQKREVHPGERWNLHSPLTPAARLTSTMRYGTPFGQPPRSGQSATPSMNFSSVSLIANASSTKEVLPSHQAIDHPCDMTEGSIQQESSKNLRFDQVQFYDRVEDCRMQTSFKKTIPSSMTISRSYDSLQKYAQEKENISAQEDWLMTSLSEADLHQSRTSSEVQDMVADRDSVGTTSTSFVQNIVNKHGIAMQEGPNITPSSIHHGIGEHGGAAQQGCNSHPVFQRSTSDLLQYQDSEMPESSNSSHIMKGVQEGSMANNFETPCMHKVPDNESASKLHGNPCLSTNAQEGDLETRKVSPLRPISVNLLSHITRTGVDSGYNTNSANVSMDIGELENSS